MTIPSNQEINQLTREAMMTAMIQLLDTKASSKFQSQS